MGSTCTELEDDDDDNLARSPAGVLDEAGLAMVRPLRLTGPPRPRLPPLASDEPVVSPVSAPSPADSAAVAARRVRQQEYEVSPVSPHDSARSFRSAVSGPDRFSSPTMTSRQSSWCLSAGHH